MIIIHVMNRSYVPRLTGRSLSDRLAVMPGVVLMGARQTGKSTLIGRFEAEPAGALRTYWSLDDLDTMALARTDPMALVGGSAPVALDEVQRAPDLLRAVKAAIDTDGLAVSTEDLAAALTTLTARQRDAVVYHHVAGLSYAEIGTLLGSSEAAAQVAVLEERLAAESAILADLADLADLEGDLEQALAHYDAALAILEARRDSNSYAAVGLTNKRASVIWRLDDPERATAEFHRAFELTLAHAGHSSPRALEILKGAGFTKVRSLKGGIDAWAGQVDGTIPRY